MYAYTFNIFCTIDKLRRFDVALELRVSFLFFFFSFFLLLFFLSFTFGIIIIRECSIIRFSRENRGFGNMFAGLHFVRVRDSDPRSRAIGERTNLWPIISRSIPCIANVPYSSFSLFLSLNFFRYF